jgi:hypothetical protein
MASVPTRQAGMGAGMNDTTRELGGTLGVAVLGSVLASQYAAHVAPATAGLSTAAAGTAKASLAGALHAAATLPAGPAAQLADAARSAWMGGLSTAMVLGALIILAAAVIARIGLPGTPALEEALAEAESTGDALAPVAA